MRRLYKSRGAEKYICPDTFFLRIPFLHCTILVLTSQLPTGSTQNFRLDVSDVAVEEVLSTLGSESAFIAKYNVGGQDV